MAAVCRRAGAHIATTEGRQLLIRPAARGEGALQLAVIGKRGSVQEAVGIGLEQIPAVIFALDELFALAWRAREVQQRKSRRARERGHQDALDRNPWLKRRPRAKANATFIVRPR